MWRKWVVGVSLAVLAVAMFGVLASAEEKQPAAATVGADLESRVVMSVVIEGANQGKIRGDTRDGAIEVAEYQHEVMTAREAGSGQATGRRQYQPLLIRKRIDKASPLLYRALVSNENLNTVTVRLADIHGIYYTVTLRNASIAGIKQARTDSGEYEEISFVFQKIEWTWVDGGITAEDDWSAPER